jgi:hypothetical protein
VRSSRQIGHHLSFLVTAEFSVLASMSGQLGYDSWYILVDKIDEDSLADGDAAKSAQLIAPLLKDLNILTTPGVGFKFFLWDQLRNGLNDAFVRLDKIKNWSMSWNEAEIRTIIDRRLQAYSKSRVKNLGEICDPQAAKIVYSLVSHYSQFSPREIIHILDSIFREHARNSAAGEGALMTLDSIDFGLDAYCRERVSNIFPLEQIRSLLQLPTETFTSHTVEQRYKISQPGASTKIKGWQDNGLVERIDDTPSETGGSRKVHQYKVRDPRLSRIISRNLHWRGRDIYTPQFP